MIDQGCSYIGLGGLVGIPGPLRRVWLDRVFTLITDEAGKPLVKTHGFGMTSIPLIFRYPWYSVDSTSWIKVSQFGGVYLPRLNKDGSFRFDVTPEVISVSELSPNQKVDGSHYNSLGVTTRRHLHAWLESCGVTLEQVSHNYYYRAKVNATFFHRVGEAREEHVFSRPVGNRGLFY
jgi:hypothetical protein